MFGPDGNLYAGVGDEGGAGDPHNNAQDRSRIFGKILRIDVDQNVDTPPYYGIPASNPYVGNSSGYREDIWAYGLRNPWRISFDGNTLIAADVGQAHFEEIDIVQKGGNYGWDCREGLVAYDESDDSSSALCGTAEPFIDPIHVYDHSVGQSITGGYVYRGPKLGLTGKYIYGDFDAGRIWSLDLDTKENTELVHTDQFITTFGVGEDHELYVGAYFADGTASSIYRIAKKESFR
jgi:glucose/arabinose dehydrogenase